MPAPIADILQLQHDSIIELFELDLNPLGFNTFYRFCNYSNELNNVLWQGQPYVPVPIAVSGYEFNGQGQLPRPKLAIGNVGGIVTALTQQFDDLVGARLTRKRTLAKYLDGMPQADPSQFFDDDIYFIDRKETENELICEFELASSLDMQGVMLPHRVMIANTCIWAYRSAECSYTGALPTCDKTLADCKRHFGQYAELPYGGFPGLKT